MKIISSYKVQIKQPNHLFDDTVNGINQFPDWA